MLPASYLSDKISTAKVLSQARLYCSELNVKLKKVESVLIFERKRNRILTNEFLGLHATKP